MLSFSEIQSLSHLTIGLQGMSEFDAVRENAMVTIGISLFTKVLMPSREAERSSLVSSKEKTSCCSPRPASPIAGDQCCGASIHPYCGELLGNVTLEEKLDLAKLEVELELDNDDD